MYIVNMTYMYIENIPSVLTLKKQIPNLLTIFVQDLKKPISYDKQHQPFDSYPDKIYYQVVNSSYDLDSSIVFTCT